LRRVAPPRLEWVGPAFEAIAVAPKVGDFEGGAPAVVFDGAMRTSRHSLDPGRRTDLAAELVVTIDEDVRLYGYELAGDALDGVAAAVDLGRDVGKDDSAQTIFDRTAHLNEDLRFDSRASAWPETVRIALTRRCNAIGKALC
jgi:hypothetical protein